MAQDVKSSNINPAKNIVKVNILRANIKQTKVIDTDIVFVLEDGRTVFIRDGAVQSLLDNGFSVEFSDGILVSGQELLQSAGTAEISSVALTGPQASSNDGVIVVQAPQATVAPEVVKSSSGSSLTTWLAVGTPVVGGALAGLLGGGGGSSTNPDNNVVTVKPAMPVINVIANDDKVNAAEKSAGVTVSGNADASASVTVNWGNTSKTVTADSAGRWSASFASSEVPADAAGTTVSATVKSAAGVSSDPATKTVQVDTTLPGSPVIAKVAGDGIIGPVEKAAGIGINGTAEAGSTVTVVFGTVSKSAVADIGGNWSVNFASSDLPDPGSYAITATVRDANGNVSAAPATSQVTVSAAVDVTGQIVAGPLVAGHGLSVDIFLANGTLLLSGVKVNTDGSFTVKNLLAGVGDVIIAKVVDATPGADYLDETTRLPTDLTAELLATKVLDSTSVTMNINPLTTIAAIKAGLAVDGSGTVASADIVKNANVAVAQAFGIPGIDITTTPVVATNSDGFSQSGGLSAGERVGVVLAALSGYDKVNAGNSTATIAMLSEQLNVQGNKGELAKNGQVALMTGAIFAEDQVDGSLQTVISNTVAESSLTSQVTIAAVATDNIISGNEMSRLALSGKVTSDVVSVSVLIGTQKFAANIVGSEWSYVLSAAELAALGADGAKTIDVEAVLTNSTTVTSSRLVSLKTTPPAIPTLDAISGDNGISAAEKAAGVTFTGRSEIGSTVTLKLGTVTKEVVVDATGAWSIRLSNTEIPADGSVSASVSAKDPFGNISAPTIPRLIQIDTVAPGKPTILPVTGDNFISPAEKAAGIQIQGKSEAEATINLTFGSVKRTTTADASGNWSVNLLGTDLPADGKQTFTVTQSDRVGNESEAETGAVTIDANPPAKPDILSVTPDNIINAAEKNVGVTVRGTSEPNATIEIKWGVVTRSVKAQANGTWSVTFTTAQIPIDGETQITATATDASGNKSEPYTHVLSIDTRTDAVTIDPIATDDVINAAEKQTDLKITGGAEAGAKVVVNLGGNEETTSADKDGKWTVVFAAAKIPNDIISTPVTAKATDLAGNESAETQRAIRINSAAPAAPVIDIVTRDGVIDGLEAQSPVNVTGSAVAGTRVKVAWGTVVREADVAANGKWSVTFAPTEIPADGVSKIVATVRNSDQNESAPAERNVTVDVGTIPAVIDAITADNIINAIERNDGVTVTGSAEAGAKVRLVWGSVTKETTVGTDGKWSQLFSTAEIPTSGDSFITATPTDQFGNVGTTERRDFVIDTTVSAATFDNVTSDNKVNATEKSTALGVRVSGTAEKDSKVEVTWGSTVKTVTADGSGVWRTSFATNEVPSDGKTKIIAKVTDFAGNVSALSNWDVEVDTAAPATPFIISPIAGDDSVNVSELVAGVAVTGTAEAKATVTIVGRDKTTGVDIFTKTVTADDNGNWTTSFSSAEINETATVQIIATAKDVAGNSSDPATKEVFVNTGRPAKPVIDPIAALADNYLNAAEAALGLTTTGTGTPGSTVSVTWGGITKTSAPIGPDGKWTVNFTSAEVSAPGNYSITAVQTDALGNQSAPVTLSDIIVDTAAPIFPAVTAAIAGNDVINLAEKNAVGGVVVSGVAPGADKVDVRMGSSTKTNIPVVDGKWSVTFASGEIPADAQGVKVEGRSYDTAGNTSDWTEMTTVDIDTTPPTGVPVITSPIATDGIVDFSERAAGVVVSGKATPNAKVQIDWGTTSSKTVDVNALGNWTSTFATGEINATGLATISAREVDAAGNFGTADTENVTVSSAQLNAIRIDRVSSDDVVNLAERNAGVTISGTLATAGATVVVTWGGKEKISTPAGSDGIWSVFFPTNDVPTSGSQPVTAYQRDIDGNRSGISTQSADIDIIPDAVPVITTPIAGDNVINVTEKAAGVTVTTSALSTHKVQFRIDGGGEKDATKDASNIWSYTFAAGDIPADKTGVLIEARSIDVNGNPSAWVSKTVNVDTSAPTVALNSNIAGDDVINTSELTAGVDVSGSVTGSASTVQVKWGATAERTVNVDANGFWTTKYQSGELTSEVNKTAQLTVTATDGSGNVSAPVSRNIKIDTLPPATPVITGMSNDYGTGGDFITDRNRVFITGTGEANSKIEITRNGVKSFADVDSLGNWVSPEIDLTAGGVATLSFASIDAAGNRSTTSVTQSVTKQIISATRLELSAMTPATGFTLSGARNGDLITGFTRGDINGDGVNDLILSSPNAATSGGFVVGAVTVRYGLTNTSEDLLSMGTANGWVLQGTQINGGLGSSVGFIGDLNGDKYGELIAGASKIDNGSFVSAGAAYIVWGSNTPIGNVSGNQTILGATGVTATRGFTFHGLTANEEMGHAVLGISSKIQKVDATTSVNLNSDFNGDGLADFFISAPKFDRDASGTTQTAATDVGAVMVVFGRADLNYGTVNATFNKRDMTINDLTSDKGFIIRGAAAGDVAGSSLASAGDVNGDGVTDLLIGAPNVDRDGFTTAGAAYVIYGKKTPTGATWSGLIDDPTMPGRKILDLGTLKSTDGFMIQGETGAGTTPAGLSGTGNIFGNSVEGLGDVNGDGYDDIGIGAAASASPSLNSGKAFVIFGGPNGQGSAVGERQVLDVTTMTSSQGFSINGATGWLGSSVGAAGDVNDDGLADMIFSAPFSPATAGNQAGVSYVIYGKEKGVQFGSSVSGQSILNLTNWGPADGFSIAGRNASDQLGNQNGDSSIVAPGDLNNDGIDDLFINNYRADISGKTDNGQAVFVYGLTQAGNSNGSQGGVTRNGGSNAETINGTDGRDFINGNGGADILRGFAGNDRIIVDDMNFALVDGGTGTDTLIMDGNVGLSLNLSTLAAGLIKDIEMIDMGVGALANTLTLTQQTLIDLSSTTDILKVLGDTADKVNAAGFTFVSTKLEDGITYNTYKSGAAELWTQMGVVVDITTPPPPASVVPQAFAWTDQAVLAA